jgi:hypothetical protein
MNRYLLIVLFLVIDALPTAKIYAETTYEIDKSIESRLNRPPRLAPPLTPKEICERSGGIWSEEFQDCFPDAKSLCEATDHVWDTRQNICLVSEPAIACFERGAYWIPDRNICVETIADVCREQGGVWNAELQQCLRSLDAIECVATGGIWMESELRCIYLTPDGNA